MRRRLPAGGRWLAALVGAALAAWAPARAGAAPPEPALFDQLFGSDPAAERAGKASDGLALPDLFIGGQRIAEALPLVDLGPKAGGCVEFAALLGALELAHQADADGGFSVTLPDPARTVRIEPSSLEQSPGGPCLPLAALPGLLPFTLTHDAENQRLVVTANAPLPVQMRLARAERQARVQASTARPAYPLLERQPARARLWSADLALGLFAASGNRDLTATVVGAGEVLGLGARFSLGLAADRLPTVGLVLGEASETPSLLGPLSARSLALGDISSPAQPLIADTLGGRGLLISSRAPWRADLVDEITLSGPLSPGWEAELWHENRLVAFTRKPDAAGQWQFAGLPVRLGENRWTVRLYGPHGEQDEQSFTRLVGSAMNAENEIDYAVGVIEGGKALVGSAPTRTPSGAAAHASVGWGVTPALTARLDVRAPLAADPSMALGLHGALGGTLWAATAARDGLGGTGIGLRLARRFGAQDLVLDLARHGRDAGPHQAPQVREFSDLAGLTAQGRLPAGRLSLPWQVRLQSATRRTGGRQQAVAGRLSVPLADWQASAALGLTRQGGAGWQGNAGLGLSANLGPLRMRSGVDATLGDRWRLGGISVGSSYAMGAGSLALDLGWQAEQGALAAGVSLNHRLGPFGLSANAGRGADGWRLGLGLVVGLWRGPDRWHTAPAGLARSGSVLADLFVDENGDGDRDPGEAGVKGGRFIAGAALRGETTAEDGRVLIRGLPAGPSFDIETQLASLEDFTLRPARPGDRLSLRPGEVRQVQIPLRRTGSIEVQVRLAAGDRLTPRAGIPVALKDNEGRAVAQAESDFEGYVLFEGLPLGRWQVEAAGQSVPGIALSVERPEASATLDIPVGR